MIKLNDWMNEWMKETKDKLKLKAMDNFMHQIQVYLSCKKYEFERGIPLLKHANPSLQTWPKLQKCPSEDDTLP